MIATGTNPPIKMIEYLRKQAKPRKIFPADPQAVGKKMPTMSVQQIAQRNEAKQAANRGFYTPANNINPSMLDDRRGELIARREAHSRANFEAFDAHREHVEAALDNQRQYEAGNRLYEQTAERLALQRSYGTSHAEMQPGQLGDIAQRYNQLRVLIQQNVGIAQQAQTRTLQRRRNLAPRTRGNARLAFSSGYQYQR